MLSIICPAIRSERWEAMYKSIEESYHGEWELILITEADVPKFISSKNNVTIVYSQQSPMAKQQCGLSYCRGKYVTVMSDDSTWLPNMLDKAVAHFESTNPADKDLMVMKYLEGPEFDFPPHHIAEAPDDMKFKTNYDFMKSDKYYFSDTHDSSKMPGIPYHSPILSVALIPIKLLRDVGGWDGVNFSSQAMGNVDLAARLMYYGCRYFIYPEVVSTCGYFSEGSVDHGPIHLCQLLSDEPLLKRMYVMSREDRIFLCLKNWEHSERIWKWKDKDTQARKADKGLLLKFGLTEYLK